MTFTYHNRQGMTVLPDDIDDVTGERIENTSQVVDTRIANWTDTPVEDDPDLIEEAIQDDSDHPDYVSEEERLAATEEAIFSAEELAFSSELASAIPSVDLGNNPSDIVVKHLATQYYLGNISRDDAFNQAIETGINPDDLADSFWRLQSHFE